MSKVQRAVAFITDNPDLFKKEPGWFIDNWHVIEAFENTALRLIALGRTHYSARTIVEVLVHNSAIREIEGDYKIGNDNAPDLARLFVVLHPQHIDFWEYRRANHKDFVAAINRMVERQQMLESDGVPA